MKPLRWIISVLLFSVSVCSANESSPMKVSLIPQWLPQAQFAGYMVALDKGFYGDVGLDVTLLKGGPGKPSMDYMCNGQATFCTDWLINSMKSRVAGRQIVCIAQIIQRSALCIVAKKESGITEVSNLHGKRIGLWEGHFYLQPMLLFKRLGIEIDIIPNYSSCGLFLKGNLDAMSAMWYNEYHTLLNSGRNPDDLKVFFFSDFELNFPEDGLYVTQETFDKYPEACANFAEASLRGWLYAFDHQEEALDIVMKFARAAHTGTNRPHQRWMLAKMKELAMNNGDASSFGKLKIDDYLRVGEALKDLKIIDQIPSYEDFYRGPH
jgi:NitT/TauT family transport system substrate-binding protein